MTAFRVDCFSLRLHLPLLLALIVAGSLLSWHMNDPWIYSNDSNGPMHAVFAKNYLREGYGQTLLGQRMSPRIWEEDLDSPTMLKYYVDHPPLVPVLVSLSFRLFGVSEASTRLVAIVFSLSSVALIYYLAQKIFDRDTAIISLCILLVTPMFLFFGKMTNHEVVTNVFILSATMAYLKWIEEQSVKYAALLLLALVLGMTAGWPAYYLCGLLVVHYAIFVRGQQGSIVILFLPVVALSAFGLFLLHVYVLEGVPGLASLIQKFFLRAGGGFNWSRFSVTLARYFDYGFTPVLILLAFFSLLREKGIYRINLASPDTSASILIVLFGVAIVHVILFKQGASEHPYWIYYFSAPLAICGARAIWRLALSLTNEDSKVYRFGIYAMFLLLLVWLSAPRTKYFYSPNRVGAFRLGQLLNHRSRPGEAVVLQMGYQGTQLPYYADRDLRYSITTLAALQRILAQPRVNYRYYVAPENPGMDRDLQNYLRKHYLGQSVDGYVFYDLQGHRMG